MNVAEVTIESGKLRLMQSYDSSTKTSLRWSIQEVCLPQVVYLKNLLKKISRESYYEFSFGLSSFWCLGRLLKFNSNFSSNSLMRKPLSLSSGERDDKDKSFSWNFSNWEYDVHAVNFKLWRKREFPDDRIDPEIAHDHRTNRVTDQLQPVFLL